MTKALLFAVCGFLALGLSGVLVAAYALSRAVKALK